LEPFAYEKLSSYEYGRTPVVQNVMIVIPNGDLSLPISVIMIETAVIFLTVFYLCFKYLYPSDYINGIKGE
jgi:hypothetical protein